MNSLKLMLCLAFAVAAGTETRAQESNLPTTEKMAKELIGGEYVHMASLQPSCMAEGGSSFVDATGKTMEGWVYSNLWCMGKPVLTMEKSLGYEGPHLRVRIVDAIVIPSYDTKDAEPPSPSKLYKTEAGPCTLDGKRNKNLIALVREDRPMKNGEQQKVVHAYGFDLKREKIVSISTKRVRCVHDEP